MTIFAIVSIIFSINSIDIPEEIKFSIGNSIINLMYAFFLSAMVLIIIAVIIRAVPYFECAKAIKLMNKIMKTEGEVNVDDIRNEWFKKRDYFMWNKIKKYIFGFTWLKYFGLLLILISIGLFYVNGCKINDWCEVGKLIITIALGLIAMGVSFDSDRKMKMIANANFVRDLNEFEQTRVYFIGPPPRYSMQLFIWRSRTILEGLAEYDKNLIKTIYQKRLFNMFVVSMRELFAKHTWASLRRKQRDVIIMYSIAREYPREKNNFNELIRILETHMGKTQDETEEEFFSRIK